MHWIFAHLIGDYLIQNDFMAANKKKSSKVCLLHVVTYMIPFLLCHLNKKQICLIAAQHYAINRSQFIFWWFKKTGKTKFGEAPTAPWSYFLIDNIFHILWIAFIIWCPFLQSKRNNI